MIPWMLWTPLFGSLFIGLITSVLGVMLFIRRRALIGETLSHAAFPGVVMAALLSFFFDSELSPLWLLCGAVFFAIVGHLLVDFIRKKGGASDDSALTFVLVGLFGIGVTLMTLLQHLHPASCQCVSASFFGQIATMDDSQALFYGLFSLFILFVFALFYKEFKVMAFDAILARRITFSKSIDALLFVLVAFVIAISIRTVGVLLISAMLIAPSIAARKLTDRLLPMLSIAALVGLTSTGGGILLSYHLSHRTGATLPAGPLIVLIASSMALLSLLFAPRRGVLTSGFRVLFFQVICYQENLLKKLWKSKEGDESFIDGSSLIFKATLFYFRCRGWVKVKNKECFLTRRGELAGAKIVRLHRLWESYLVDLGVPKESVHRSAEEMEHILDAALEEKLTHLLSNPTHDPHKKPIPNPKQELDLE